MEDEILAGGAVVMGHRIGQGYFRALSGNRVYQLVDGFIDNEEEIVLIADIQGRGEGFNRRGFGEFAGQCIAGLQHGEGSDDLPPVDRYGAVVLEAAPKAQGNALTLQKTLEGKIRQAFRDGVEKLHILFFLSVGFRGDEMKGCAQKDGDDCGQSHAF